MFRVIVPFLALISTVVGQDPRQPELPPLPAPIGCKSVDQFDECVRPAANALLCRDDDIPCLCSGYRIERRCYTAYCPGNSWEYEDHGTTCGPTITAAAKAPATSAGAPSHAAATATKGAQAKGNIQKSSAASKAGAAAAVASGLINAGAHSATVNISSLLVMAAAALSTLIPR